ncbi:MAG: thioredoxin domain-containing protein [Gemmatimonadota bacterium]
MAKKSEQGTSHRARRPGVVQNAKRGGPGRGFWLGLAGIAVLGIAVLAWQTTQKPAAIRKVDPSLPTLKAEGYLMGSPTAPLEIVEFADFECPSCGQFATLTEPDVRARLVNTGKVRIRFMDFPLEMHKNTWHAHLAAACANDQGKFWEMHDAIFANQDKWNGETTGRPRGPLGDLAKGIGLDMAKYNTCMDAETHLPQVQANQAEGLRRNVNQTPTFLFGDELRPGAASFDTFKAYAEMALAADSTRKAKEADSVAKAAKTAPKLDNAKKGT